jgi:hypothetical protein
VSGSGDENGSLLILEIHESDVVNGSVMSPCLRISCSIVEHDSSERGALVRSFGKCKSKVRNTVGSSLERMIHSSIADFAFPFVHNDMTVLAAISRRVRIDLTVLPVMEFDDEIFSFDRECVFKSSTLDLTDVLFFFPST